MKTAVVEDPVFLQEGPSEQRALAPEHEDTYHSGPFPMSMLPRKYQETHEHNQKLKICCRHVENLATTFYCTYTADNGKPDKMITVCQECGCKHYRIAVSAMSI